MYDNASVTAGTMHDSDSAAAGTMHYSASVAVGTMHGSGLVAAGTIHGSVSVATGTMHDSASLAAGTMHGSASVAAGTIHDSVSVAAGTMHDSASVTAVAIHGSVSIAAVDVHGSVLYPRPPGLWCRLSLLILCDKYIALISDVPAIDIGGGRWLQSFEFPRQTIVPRTVDTLLWSWLVHSSCIDARVSWKQRSATLCSYSRDDNPRDKDIRIHESTDNFTRRNISILTNLPCFVARIGRRFCLWWLGMLELSLIPELALVDQRWRLRGEWTRADEVAATEGNVNLTNQWSKILVQYNVNLRFRRWICATNIIIVPSLILRQI